MSKGNAFLALVAGTAIGAIAGLLYAPEKGSTTRQNLKDGLDDLKSNLKGKFDNASGDVMDQFSNLEETYENLVSNVSHKAEDVITFLESKLAELKMQNAKFQKEPNQYSE